MNKESFLLIFAAILIPLAALFSPGLAFILIFVVLFIITTAISNKRKNMKDFDESYASGSDAAQRRHALWEAKIFLAPYNDIWRDLKLSNKYCSIILDHDGVTIRCIEKVKPYRKFQVTSTPIHTPFELWNMFCIYFSHNKSYDGVMEDCYRYHVSTIETTGTDNLSNTIVTENFKSVNNDTIEQNQNQNLQKNQPINKIQKEKLDINNCSEVELTDLPGISIVIAKKVIKKREENGGFKSVNEFLEFIKLKPHMETQLKELVKVEKMKGSLYQKKYTERSVDF